MYESMYLAILVCITYFAHVICCFIYIIFCFFFFLLTIIITPYIHITHLNVYLCIHLYALSYFEAIQVSFQANCFHCLYVCLYVCKYIKLFHLALDRPVLCIRIGIGCICICSCRILLCPTLSAAIRRTTDAAATYNTTATCAATDTAAAHALLIIGVIAVHSLVAHRTGCTGYANNSIQILFATHESGFCGKKKKKLKKKLINKFRIRQ